MIPSQRTWIKSRNLAQTTQIHFTEKDWESGIDCLIISVVLATNKLWNFYSRKFTMKSLFKHFYLTSDINRAYYFILDSLEHVF